MRILGPLSIELDKEELLKLWGSFSTTDYRQLFREERALEEPNNGYVRVGTFNGVKLFATTDGVTNAVFDALENIVNRS